ncbi:helix-turn-helix domain-containing protein [Streptomyces sp. TRM 70361]|uniref:helix-turn-helix domain-containing protein n=1 Tax=Streptomyces sp. TRM 70361 TaxID=3116553 RepID=UPI002E7C4932|nr:helix-turn-helix domain-containing protein [Streptomyces sp. TRM 70361]MEE1942562.1 helix-turn-helix domain-containing protein [Streptomyces sp. TRM 70361]
MPRVDDEHIGTRVRIARTAAGLTQRELADFLSRSEVWLANVESGRVSLDRYSVITAIAERCDVDVVWLLGQPYRLRREGGGLAHSCNPALRTAMRRASPILSGHPGLAPLSGPVDMTGVRKTLRKANLARQAANLPEVARLLPPVVEHLNTALLSAGPEERGRALRARARTPAESLALLESLV